MVGGRNERGCEVACEAGGRRCGDGQRGQDVDMAYRRYGVSWRYPAVPYSTRFSYSDPMPVRHSCGGERYERARNVVREAGAEAAVAAAAEAAAEAAMDANTTANQLELSDARADTECRCVCRPRLRRRRNFEPAIPAQR